MLGRLNLGFLFLEAQRQDTLKAISKLLDLLAPELFFLILAHPVCKM